jgi:hypothetical protein
MTQNIMSGYYGQPYQSSVDHNRTMDSFMQQGMASDISQGMVDTAMAGEEGQTLDQIINQNDLELQRQRSTYHPGFHSNDDHQSHTRRSSMLEFASSKDPDRADFQFDPSQSQPSMQGQMVDAGHPQKASQSRKLRSQESLALDTRFNQMNPAFCTVSNYSPAIMTSTPIDLDPTSQYLSSNMEIPMNFESAGGDRTPMNIQPQIERQPIFTTSPTHQPFSPIFHSLGQDSPTRMDQSLMDKVSQMRMPEQMRKMSAMNGQGAAARSVMPTTKGSSVPTMTSPAHPQQPNATPIGNLGIRSPYGNGSKQFTAHRVRIRLTDGKF